MRTTRRYSVRPPPTGQRRRSDGTGTAGRPPDHARCLLLRLAAILYPQDFGVLVFCEWFGAARQRVASQPWDTHGICRAVFLVLATADNSNQPLRYPFLYS
jgi:hypothetical protein